MNAIDITNLILIVVNITLAATDKNWAAVSGWFVALLWLGVYIRQKNKQ